MKSSLPDPSRTVLIVEDDFDIRDALVQVLRDEGYGVAAASNGAAGLELLRDHGQVGLILLDLRMPVMDGWEFRATQRRDPTLSEIPVVVLSADHGAERSAQSLQVDGFLQKPVELDALLTLVQRHCR